MIDQTKRAGPDLLEGNIVEMPKAFGVPVAASGPWIPSMRHTGNAKLRVGIRGESEGEREGQSEGDMG